MKFFRLVDDVHIDNRWHLGEAIDRHSQSSIDVWHGLCSNTSGVDVELSLPGKALEFCLTSYALPIANDRLAGAIIPIAGEDLQVVPVYIPGYSGFNLLNSVRVIRCLDERRSKFVKWSKQDHRPDLAGQYRMVTELKVNVSEIPFGTHFFRIADWQIALVISEILKAAMESCGCLGAKFDEVS